MDKKYILTLGGHSESVSEQELADLKARYHRNFPYDVAPLQIARPTDADAKPPVPAAPALKPADAPKPTPTTPS